MKRINKVFILLFFIAVGINLFFASWTVMHGDIEFSSEIARDFFLLQEIDQKKIVFIGPSSTTGLFHGPLWSYINYPAYFIGGGDPVIVGWNWILLVLAFLISGFFMAKKLFNTQTAYLFVLMTSVYFAFHAKGFYNPHGAMLLIPSFFFFFIRYIQTLKVKYLVVHILIAGAIIQLQMAIGIPFFILSFLYGSVVALKSKKQIHVVVYLLIFATLANFIIFDLRHEFLLSKLTVKFLTSAGRDNPNVLSMIEQRVKLMTGGVEILRRDPGYRNYITFFIFVFFLFLQIKHNKYKKIYFSFLYFYVGYLILSMGNAGGLLYFYLFPLFPFVFLIFSSFVTSRYRFIFLVVFFVIYALNSLYIFYDISFASKYDIGKGKDSWLLIKNIAFKTFSGKENEFGYFVYSPDIVGYRSKYAMRYAEEQHIKKAGYFKKMPVTYLILEPDQYKRDEWWKKYMFNLEKKPETVIQFGSGYSLEKYLLTEKEIQIPITSGIDPGIHFR